jgi:hypothetical protein
MSIKPITVIDVAETDTIQLSRIASTCRVDGDQNWPGETATDKTYEDDGFEESKE